LRTMRARVPCQTSFLGDMWCSYAKAIGGYTQTYGNAIGRCGALKKPQDTG
jgi:hypothetical protein